MKYMNRADKLYCIYVIMCVIWCAADYTSVWPIYLNLFTLSFLWVVTALTKKPFWRNDSKVDLFFIILTMLMAVLSGFAASYVAIRNMGI